MIKVDYRPQGKFSPDSPSLVKQTWAKVDAKFSIGKDEIVVSTSKLTAKIKRSPCRLAVYDKSGKLLVKEQDAKGAYPGGLNLNGPENSHYFGIHGFNSFEHAGSQVELGPRVAPYSIGAGVEGNTGGPFIWSNKGFGVYVDTVGGQCAVSDPTSIQFSKVSKANVEYFVIAGNAYAMQESLDRLTGLPPMFPKWALGLFNSEFCGIKEPLFREIVDGYRSRGIPFDTYVFDFDWKDWSGDHYGEWRWDAERFPSGPSGQLKQDMDAKGIKMVGIMKPRIHVDSEQGRYATDHGFWVKGRAFYKDYFDNRVVGDLDFSIPACRDWFWDHSKGAYDRGIIGWWNDEADAWNDDLEFMYMAQSQYEGQREYTKNRQRVYTINRNFYSGSQRYAYATWSGDIDSGFAVMQDQRVRLMDSLNVGQAKWGMDTGGFNNDNRVHGDEASECYARWIEFDVFAPIFRLHGTSRRQPWVYGPVAEAAAKKAARLRYSFLPYMYSYDRLLSTTGVGLCRPLIWDYPNDETLVNNVDSWMFGDYLLASPVVGRGQSEKPIYLPEGTWVDYFRGTVYKGGQTIQYPVNAKTLDDIPLFVKSGAIIPTAPAPSYVGERPVETVSVDVFPSAAKTGFTYYDDDGITYDYEKGKFFSQTMSVQTSGAGVAFSISGRIGSFVPPLRSYLCKFHGALASSVRVNGKAAKEYESTQLLALALGDGWAKGKDVYGDVVWVKVAAGRPCKIQLNQ